MTNTTANTEELLMIAFQKGDERAFASIYERFHQRVYYFAQRFVTEPEAKDVAAEAFIKLWNARATFESFQSISNFLFVIARNKCMDVIKHEAVKTKKHAELIQLLETSEETDFFLEQVKTELIRHIYNEVNKLPPKMKEIFLLSFSEGLKPAQIAERLQISVQTVSNQKLTAIRVLKAALGSNAFLLSLLILMYADR